MLTGLCFPCRNALARPEYWDLLHKLYRPKPHSALATAKCMTCHLAGFEDEPKDPQGKFRNAFAHAFEQQGTFDATALKNIQGLDSDGDGWPNGMELTQGTLPGDAHSFPPGPVPSLATSPHSVSRSTALVNSASLSTASGTSVAATAPSLAKDKPSEGTLTPGVPGWTQPGTFLVLCILGALSLLVILNALLCYWSYQILKSNMVLLQSFLALSRGTLSGHSRQSEDQVSLTVSPQMTVPPAENMLPEVPATIAGMPLTIQPPAESKLSAEDNPACGIHLPLVQAKSVAQIPSGSATAQPSNPPVLHSQPENLLSVNAPRPISQFTDTQVTDPHAETPIQDTDVTLLGGKGAAENAAKKANTDDLDAEIISAKNVNENVTDEAYQGTDATDLEPEQQADSEPSQPAPGHVPYTVYP